MNLLLVLAVTVSLASADIGLTLNNYKVPETSYGVPSYQYDSNTDYNTGYSGGNGYHYKVPVENSAHAGYEGFGQQNTGYESSFQSANSLGSDYNGAGYNTQYHTGGGNQYYQTGGLNTGSGYNSGSHPTYQFGGSSSSASAQGGYHTYNQYQTSSEYQSSAVNKYQEFYNQWKQQPVQVFKHFYVHAAPEEPEKPKIHQPVALPPPQKHYKIIFIKAPQQTTYVPQYIPVPQQNEEKTIVYVLVKKPEDQHEIIIPKVEQKPPAKPEVFFIKYNNKADSQAVINNIVDDYNKVNTVSVAGGSGSEAQGFNTGSGQYTTGQYYPGATGQYNQGNSGYNTQGAYDQFGQNAAGSQTVGSFGGHSFGSTGHGGSTDSNSASYSTATAASSTAAAASLNAISTSQGVPHETYGPPTFKVQK